MPAQDDRTPDDHAQAAELGAAIDLAIWALPVKSRDAIEYWRRGCSYVEIAGLCGCTLAQATSRVQRGRVELRQRLEGWK